MTCVLEGDDLLDCMTGENGRPKQPLQDVKLIILVKSIIHGLRKRSNGFHSVNQTETIPILIKVVNGHPISFDEIIEETTPIALHVDNYQEDLVFNHIPISLATSYSRFVMVELSQPIDELASTLYSLLT